MKKFIAFILSVLYLGTSIGATVHYHYCMDKLVAWSLDSGKNDGTCSYCGMVKQSSNDEHCEKDSKGCCKDEIKQLKIEKDQKATENNFDLSKLLLHPITITPLEITVTHIATCLEYPVTNSPPRADNTSLFVRNCVFLI